MDTTDDASEPHSHPSDNSASAQPTELTERSGSHERSKSPRTSSSSEPPRANESELTSKDGTTLHKVKPKNKKKPRKFSALNPPSDDESEESQSEVDDTTHDIHTERPQSPLSQAIALSLKGLLAESTTDEKQSNQSPPPSSSPKDKNESNSQRQQLDDQQSNEDATSTSTTENVHEPKAADTSDDIRPNSPKDGAIASQADEDDDAPQNIGDAEQKAPGGERADEGEAKAGHGDAKYEDECEPAQAHCFFADEDVALTLRAQQAREKLDEVRTVVL